MANSSGLKERPSRTSLRGVATLYQGSMSALVGLGAAGIGGQLDTLGRDLDHLPAAPDREGHAQLPVSLDHPAASCDDGPINRRPVPNDALHVTRWSSAHATSSIRLRISSHVASFSTTGSRAPLPSPPSPPERGGGG